MSSPYDDLPATEWRHVTEELLDAHPLSRERIVQVVRSAWASIFRSRIGDLVIGTDIFPQPQVLGFFLHELIPVELAKEEPGWRRGSGAEKDAEFPSPNDHAGRQDDAHHRRRGRR